MSTKWTLGSTAHPIVVATDDTDFTDKNLLPRSDCLFGSDLSLAQTTTNFAEAAALLGLFHLCHLCNLWQRSLPPASLLKDEQVCWCAPGFGLFVLPSSPQIFLCIHRHDQIQVVAPVTIPPILEP